MNEWIVPKWGEPWDPEFEVPLLKELAMQISSTHPEIKCVPDFETEGCAFCQLYRNKLNIGRVCVTKHNDGSPFYSAYLGQDEDEFHGYNTKAIISVVSCYDTELPEE